MAKKKKKTGFVSKVKQVPSKVKNYASKYKSDVNSAYNISYKSGWNDHSKLPNRKGVITIATSGYHNGLKDKAKYNKIQSRVDKRVY